MKKRESGSELHTIQNEKRPRVVKKRSGKTAFKARRHRRLTQVLAMFSCFAILGVGIFAIGSIFNKADPNVVDPGFVTVSYELPSDGSLPSDHSALENVGYMNKRFAGQTKWYSEMHGSTVANTMGINVNQSVNTYKQFDNETLIMADITASSMVNKARQFCYRGDEVIWRMGSGSSSSWATGVKGEDCFAKLSAMQWQEGTPYGHMSLASFTEKNGLPGTGFSVYVINEETLLSADAVVDHGDGTYSQTYYLDPATDKAPCHYVNQMVFTGDLPSLPSFNYITVTYTFDQSWQILRSEIDEQYTAVMGVSATCTSAYRTDFEYGTHKAESTAFDDYFKSHFGAPFTEPDVKQEVTPLNCLTSAFASVLTQPVTFDLSLCINGNAVAGKVYVDVGEMSLDTMEIRAQIGGVKLWLQNGTAFIEYGGMKIKLTVTELIELIGSVTGSSGGLSLDTDALLGALAEGEFTYDEQSATLSSTLSLGFDLPVVFRFDIDEEGNVSLGNVIANIVVENLAVSSFDLGKLEIGASLQFGEGGLSALSAEEQAKFVDFAPLARDVLTVLRSEVLAIDLSYRGEGFAVEGALDIALGDLSSYDFNDLSACALAAQGTVRVTLGGAEKTVALAYRKGVLFVEADGVKLKADVKEGAALIGRLLSDEQNGQTEQAAFDLGAILSQVFSEDFARLFACAQTESGAEILILGTELLEKLGVNFALGEVKLTLGGGTIGASAFGVQVGVSASKNKIADVDETQYAAILPYVQPVLDLVKSEAISAAVRYENGALALGGTITFSLANRAAYGTLALSYADGAAVCSKTLEFAYLYAEDGGALYLALDGLKVKAQARELVGVLTKLLANEMPAIDANADLLSVLEKLLAFDFGTLLNVSEQDETLSIVVYGSELLHALGIEFDLGNVSVDIHKTGAVEITALGAQITLTASEYAAPVLEGYTDVTELVARLPAVLEQKSVAFAGSFRMFVGNNAIDVEVTHGALGFADGLNLYAALNVTIGGNRINAVLNVTQEDVAFVVDGVAARVRFSEFKDIASAVSSLYKQLASAVNGMIVTGEEDGLLADDIEALMLKLGVTELFASFAQKFDASLLAQIAIGAPVRADGICTLSFGAFKAELLNAGENRLLGAVLSYEDEKFALTGGLSVFEGGVPAMPAGDYLGADDFIELLDYASAAVNTLTAGNLTVSFRKGNVVSTQTENGAEQTTQYDVSGKIQYYSGGQYPFVINTADKTVTVNADLYLHVEFSYVDQNKNGEGIFLNLDLLDYDENGVLDFFVTLSRFAADDARYMPLKLYADANEIVNILACGCALLGVDFDLVNDYLISHYLDVKTTAQLRALGSSLLKSFGIGDLFAAFAGGAAVSQEQTETFIRDIVIGKELFTIEAGGVRIEVGKTSSPDETGAMRSYLTGVGVLAGDTCVEVAIDALSAVFVPTVTLDESYFKLEGVARLLKLLATSATQPDDASETGYALGDHYYIDGKITLNMVLNLFGGISVKGVDVKLALSVSVGENGEVSLDLHVEVPGDAVTSFVAINGKTVTDITLKEGMIYIKRVQHSYYDGSKEKFYPSPVTVYRVMPLASFTDDLINQLAFALNFGKLITDNLGSTGGDGTQTPAETQDFGAIFKSYIVSCVYAENTDGTCDYTLTLNGDSLLKGYLGNVVVQIGSDYLPDGSEVISDLGIATTLTVSVLKVDVSGALRFENPCGITANEITTDVAGIVSTAMEKALSEAQKAEWKDIPYIEGQTTSVSYVLAGETIATQDVLFDGKTGECYADLKAPDSAQFEHKGYEIVWDFSGVLHGDDGKYYVSANQIIYGSYRAKTYRLTLTDGKDWSVAFDYLYGTDLLAEINKTFATQQYFAVSCSLTADDVANGEREAFVVWETHNYAVTYYDQDGKEFAKQFYKADAALTYPENAPARVGYLFDGWQNADGVRIENGSAVTADTALYPVWKIDDSKEITVRLYSDLRYADAAFDPDRDGYYTEVTFDETSGYALSDLRLEGYQQMGWWYREENGAWTRVTNVEGKNGAILWAVWIRNIKVTVTNFAKKSSTYTIEGKVEGGAVYGKQSKEIYLAAGMSESTAGVYTIYNGDGKKSDNLKYGDEIVINYGDDGVGTFSNSGMTSFNALLWGGASYGGIRITKTFRYGEGLSVSTESASYVSLNTYTVTYQNENGETIQTVSGIRADFPYDAYDSSVYVDELADREGIAVPVKEGYTGRWEHVAVAGNITVKPVYTAA